MAKAPSDMDYTSLFVPADDLPPFEDYVEPLCNNMSEKIAAMQRKLEVSQRQEGMQTRKEIRNLWPGYGVEYKKLMNADRPLQPTGENSPNEDHALLGKAEEDNDNSLQTSLSTNGITTSNSGLYAGFATSATTLEERIDWRISFAQGQKTKDSKLFFFGTVLFRLSFGLNTSGTHHYIHIAPAERLTSDVRIHCQYLILDPASDAVLVTQVAESNYLFRRGHQDSAGIEEFIGPEMSRYLDGFKRLSLSVVVATEVGRQGQMLGLTLGPAPAVHL